MHRLRDQDVDIYLGAIIQPTPDAPGRSPSRQFCCKHRGAGGAWAHGSQHSSGRAGGLGRGLLCTAAVQPSEPHPPHTNTLSSFLHPNSLPLCSLPGHLCSLSRESLIAFPPWHAEPHTDQHLIPQLLWAEAEPPPWPWYPG